jgi:hypothetical protein
VNDLYEHPVLADFARICQPRPDHLRAIIAALCAEYAAGHPLQTKSGLARDEKLTTQRRIYDNKNLAVLERDPEARRPYLHVLLTGATGYLGSYLLRELLADPALRVTIVVRGIDDISARARLGQVLTGYFGPAGTSLLKDPRQHVLAGDLRHA